MKVYIIRDQLWAKPRTTFEPGAGFRQACLMFARSCKRGINGNSLAKDAIRRAFWIVNPVADPDVWNGGKSRRWGGDCAPGKYF